MNRALRLLALITLSLSGMAASFQPDSISMDEAIQQALSSHRDAERARLLLREAELFAQERLMTLAPRLNLNLTAPSIDDSRNEVWVGDSLQQLVWVDWNQRRESADLALSTELPLGARAGLGSSAYHRKSDTGSFPEEYGNSWTAWVTQDLIPRRTLLGDLAESGRELRLLKLEALDELAAFRHEVAAAYRDLLLGQRSLALGRAELDAGRLNMESAASRFNAGLIAESEYLRVEVEQLGREATFVSDSIRVRRQEESFARLTGYPEDATPRLKPLPALEERDWSLAELEDLLRQQNTRLLRQEHRRAQLERARREALIDRLPELELSASWSWVREGDDWDWNPDGTVLNRSLRLNLAWALFDGFAARRTHERSRIALRRNLLDRQALLEDLEAQLDELWNRRGELLRTLPLRQRQTELAERDAAITLERFEAGQVNSRDLIDADQTLSAARLNRLRLEMDLARVEAEIERLVGLDRLALVKDLEAPLAP